jgi:exodeoxyribonuclease V beta subunit
VKPSVALGQADDQVPSFDVCGPLPRGTTLLEASAGTGKTFTIAALTARYVAEEGLPIERLLVITFTRMATGELRERVRERLVRAFDGLVDVLAGNEPSEDDDILQILAAVPRAEREQRRNRLAKAIAEFDAATIETTHGFCLQVLYGLGTAGDVDRDVVLVEDVRDMVDEVVDDLYLRKFAHRDNTIAFSREDAGKVARKALDIPDAHLVPPLSNGDDLESTRRRFAERVRTEVEARKRALKILTYDDVLLRLRNTLSDPSRGSVARSRLRERYDVVLVDEFQDTDPVQWDIMRTAFDTEGKTLVLIGDPKQAIYAFRGADVHTYLKAKATVQSKWTLDVNWRSDEGLLAAYDALFQGAHLGQVGITYRNVRAAPPNTEPRLLGAPVSTPMRVRVVHTADGLLPTYQQKVKAPEARDLIACDLAAQTVELLGAKPEITAPQHDGTKSRTLHPGDIAVLVRSNRQATTVCDALLEANVPAVIGGAGSVFASGPAREWLRFLEALEQPASNTRASLAAMTQFIGWTAEQVADKENVQRWEDLHGWLHTWGRLLRDRGVATLYESVTAARDVPARALRRPSGERFMTDLRHVAQLLHDAAVTEGVGPTALANWLGRRILEADRDSENEERTRRLESDAQAVQVITVHRSKGLEFPVVMVPYAWDGWSFRIDVPVFHDLDTTNERTIDVGCPGPDLTAHRKLQEAEEQGESLRLLYVALTRARHQAVLWWAGAKDTKNSSLSRLLFDRGPDGQIPASGTRAQPDEAVVSAFSALGPEVVVERVVQPLGIRWHHDLESSSELEVGVFDRELDTNWRRASYSSITSAAHEQPTIASEPEAEVTLDEGTSGVPRRVLAGASSTDDLDETRFRSVRLALAAMPGGTLVGTLIHGVMERVAFDAPDLVAEVDHALRLEQAYFNVDLGNREDVIRGLCASIESPLGLTGGLRLRDMTRDNRLDELGFELPLVGGDDANAGRDDDLRVTDLATLLVEHLGRDDPVYAYAERLRDPALGGHPLRGYLTGSLDLVLRLPDDRFVLADYKTNRLSAADEVPTAWHYRPVAIESAMAEAHYPLQALLYSAALHRYLRWRQPDYDPARHLGGVLYLFLRGMSAAEPTLFGSRPCGVWSWCPPADLVTALSDLFDQGARR